MRAADLADAMARRGLIAPDAEPLPFGSEGRPWYVSVVLGTAGWLASLFGFLFLAISFQPDAPADFAVAGVVMVGAGFGLYAAEREGAFLEQLALALSLAGQLALIWAVGDGTDSATVTAAFAAVLSVAVVLALPDHFAKMLSAFFACIAWSLTIRFAWWGEDVIGDPERVVPLVPAFLGWIVIWAPIAVGVHLLVSREPRWMTTGARRMARPALTGLLLGLSLGTWTSEPSAALAFWMSTGQSSTNWLVLWPLLGVAAALFAAVCAFRLRHDAMLGVAIGGALLHLVHFYYMLGVTLVMKSYIMFVVGTGLLLGARWLRLRAPAGPTAPAGIEMESP